MASADRLWPMGAVTRRTGIGEHTLRAWERRFGFPQPVRLPSGHRRFPADQVRRLLLIAEALRCGCRAGDVVPLPVERLEELLRQSGRVDEATGELVPDWLQHMLDAGRRFDHEALAVELHHAATTLGLARFLRERIEPIMVEVGRAWARGDLGVRHEHFISEVVEDVLRGLRSSLGAASGRPVVLASLPGDVHRMGLQIAALAIAAAGRSETILGGGTPVDELVETAVAVDAAAVGLSLNASAVSDETVAAVTDIRRRLPARIRLWLGGSGAGTLVPLPANVQVVDTLDRLDGALRGLAE
jgi:methanogenic corrinoid protein MtbC1/predicted DNA-binding transcriptional regulator AlpA